MYRLATLKHGHEFFDLSLLVSVFLTALIRYRIAYRFLLLSVLKKAAAVGFAFNAL
jgi:hypothetical protein